MPFTCSPASISSWQCSCGVRKALRCDRWIVLTSVVFIPETRKVLLEEMDAKFGGSNHVEKGGDLMGVPDAHHAEIDVDKKEPRQHVQQVKL